MTSPISWLGPGPQVNTNTVLCLPAGIRLLAGIRADLQHLNPAELESRIIIRNWWESNGYVDYPHIEWPLLVSDIDALSSRPIDDPLTHGGHGLSIAFKGTWPSILDLLPGFSPSLRYFTIEPASVLEEIPPALMFIWNDRFDLQTLHNVTTATGRLSFLKWWLLYGHEEYLRLQWSLSPAWLDLESLQMGPEIPLPAFLTTLISAREDLLGLFDLGTEVGTLRCLHWWAAHGCEEYGIPSWRLDWHTPLRRILAKRLATFASDNLPESERPAKSLPYLPFMVRQMRPDLLATFDTKKRTGCEQLLSWWAANGQGEFKMFSDLMVDPDSETPGLNVVGYAQSVIGIAEDVRMAVRSAKLTGIPFSAIDAPMPGPSKSEHSLDSYLVEKPRYSVSLYCLPPSEIFRLGMESKQRLLNSGTYNIGGWHWELPKWPVDLKSVTDGVDEIWVYTDFVYQAFSEHTNGPILKMPLAVELPVHPGRNRAPFKLPKESFLFLLMFDGNSWLSRKNPIAAVRAFKKAFAGNRHVGLVIKAISLNRASAGWKEVEAEIGGDERVIVIDETLDRPALTQLMASCDAYVSLHRSEGFGRIIAEAMLLGIPTVTTNFSGNTEFCTAETSYLVNGPLIGLKSGDYLFAEGQQWCDPDVDEAAQQMQRLYEDKKQTEELVTAARSNLQRNFSPQTAGLAYKARLLELRASGKI